MPSGCIKLEGIDVIPAKTDGNADVYSGSGNFVLVLPKWMSDEEASHCPLCQQKFSSIRRKHHCRQCGRVFCSKCCKANIPLPQLGLGGAERVCDGCLPVAELITKSQSTQTNDQTESMKGLLEHIQDPNGIRKVVELGGLQATVALSKSSTVEVRKRCAEALHLVAMHEPLQLILIECGAIKALCGILMSASETDEQLLSYLIGALMIFAKAPNLKTKVVRDGALAPVLALCGMRVSEAIALIAVRTLNLLMEDVGSHEALIESDRNALPRLLALTLSEDEQMQEVSLKTLGRLSMGSDWHRQRIVQEDFTAGKCLMKSLRRCPKNMQVLCNAACLVANLATSEQTQCPEDFEAHWELHSTAGKCLMNSLQRCPKNMQVLCNAACLVANMAASEQTQSSLSDCLDALCSLLTKYRNNADLLCHVMRGVANFSSFHQNVYRLEQHLADVINVGMKSSSEKVQHHSVRFVLHLLHRSPERTISSLMGNGGSDFLGIIAKMPDMILAMQTSLQQHVTELSPPS